VRPQAYGPSIDVLVSNAAVNPTAGPLLSTPLEAMDKILDINVKAALALLQVRTRRGARPLNQRVSKPVLSCGLSQLLLTHVLCQYGTHVLCQYGVCLCGQARTLVRVGVVSTVVLSCCSVVLLLSHSPVLRTPVPTRPPCSRPSPPTCLRGAAL
jgi:NAD(P)-dependent dehydrogenase (short-subunit alcohol dehydrogenase family)